MPWPPRFLFIANRLCVDFVLTGGEGARAHWERWSTPKDLVEWFEACSLRVSLAHVGRRELRAAYELREAGWETAQRTLAGKSPSRKAVATFEHAAAKPDLVPMWRWGRVAWAPDATTSQALSAVARDALRFYGSEACERLRECRNPRCPLLFVDTSRPGRRAWCAMRRCGNMEKTARYRRRRKTDEGTE